MTRSAVLVASLVGLVIAVGLTLQGRGSRLIGFNGASPNTYVGVAAPGHPLCMPLGSTEDRPDHLQVKLNATADGPQPIRIVIAGLRPAATVTRWDNGVVELPLPAGNEAGSIACLDNLGDRPIQVAGQAGLTGATIDGKPQPYAVAFYLIDDHRPRRWDDMTQIVTRVGYGRGDGSGDLTGWIAVGAVAATLLASLGVAWRLAR